MPARKPDQSLPKVRLPMSSLPASASTPSHPPSGGAVSIQQANAPAVLIVVPTLDGGASDAGAVELTRMLVAGGYRPIVASRAGRLVVDVTAAGGEFLSLDRSGQNPLTMLRNAALLARVIRERRCRVVHALGRAVAWSAFLASRTTKTPLLTSWYKGFRQQNTFKRFYNGVMTRGDRVIAVSEQIAQLINDRYATPWERIAVIPVAVDVDRFDPAQVSRERVEAIRRSWGVTRDTKVVLVTGRILRRKGHHLVVRAAQRLKESGMSNLLFVFVGEDRGHTRYTGELWDLALSTGTVDMIRMASPVADMPAAFAAAAVVVSAAIQPEGVQRALLEAQAMAKPVIVSDLGAGADVVRAPPAVPEERITGLRFAANDDAALTAALTRFFAMPEPIRQAMGGRGRKWALDHFNPAEVTGQILRVYRDVIGRGESAAASPQTD
jgi:glycosyltransferase involved in cell wall biosynthesis